MLAEPENTERRFTIELDWKEVVDARFAELIMARGLRAFVNRLWATTGCGADPLPGTVLMHQSHAKSYNTLVLITTNEELGRLHPAITRPGRCLANVEFELFDTVAVRRWLAQRGVAAHETNGAMGLAHLYAHLECRTVPTRRPELGF